MSLWVLLRIKKKVKRVNFTFQYVNKSQTQVVRSQQSLNSFTSPFTPKKKTRVIHRQTHYYVREVHPSLLFLYLNCLTILAAFYQSNGKRAKP